MPTFPELYPSTDLIEQFKLSQQEAQNRYDAVIAKGTPFITLDQIPGLENDTRKVAIIGGGPTLKEEVVPGKTILDHLNGQDLIKVVTGSTHGSVDRFKNVEFAVIGLADEGMASAYTNPSPDITYIVAAQAHPKIFETLTAAGAKVFAFDAYVPGIAEGNDSAGPGSTAATAALSLFAGALQKQDIEFYGVDGSVTKRSGVTIPDYAFTKEQIDDATIQQAKAGAFRHKVTGSTLVATTQGIYEVSDNFLPQLDEFERFRQANPDVKLHFHGTSAHAGLLNAAPATVGATPVTKPTGP